MTLTSAQRVRLKIQDIPLPVNAVHYGDGTASKFLLPHQNLLSATAYVPNGASWTATGATFDAFGFVAFSGVVSANSAFRVEYQYSTFSEDHITEFLTDGGTVLGAAVQALEALMFDASKRARWMASDGSSYDDTAAMSHLRDMYKRLREELSTEAVSAGAFGSWAEGQELW